MSERNLVNSKYSTTGENFETALQKIAGLRNLSFEAVIVLIKEGDFLLLSEVRSEMARMEE
jgi:hypothetical protein